MQQRLRIFFTLSLDVGCQNFQRFLFMLNRNVYTSKSNDTQKYVVHYSNPLTDEHVICKILIVSLFIAKKITKKQSQSRIKIYKMQCSLYFQYCIFSISLLLSIFIIKVHFLDTRRCPSHVFFCDVWMLQLIFNRWRSSEIIYLFILGTPTAYICTDHFQQVSSVLCTLTEELQYWWFLHINTIKLLLQVVNRFYVLLSLPLFTLLSMACVT